MLSTPPPSARPRMLHEVATSAHRYPFLLVKKAAESHNMSLEISEIPGCTNQSCQGWYFQQSSDQRSQKHIQQGSLALEFWTLEKPQHVAMQIPRRDHHRCTLTLGILYVLWHLFSHVSSRIQAWQVQHNKSDGPEQCNIPQKHPVHFTVQTARPWHTAEASLSVRKSRWFWHGQCLWPQSMDLPEFHAKLKHVF